MNASGGILLLRLLAGGTMLIQHGWPKLMNYSQVVGQFPDPLGFGSNLSLSLAIFAEFVCAGLVVLGLFSRLALLPLIVTMAVAFFVIHGADPWQKKELAFLYLGMYASLFLSGSGDYSLQSLFKISAGRFGFLLK